MAYGPQSVSILVRCAAALFDCDGVLVDSDASIRRSVERWASPPVTRIGRLDDLVLATPDGETHVRIIADAGAAP